MMRLALLALGLAGVAHATYRMQGGEVTPDAADRTLPSETFTSVREFGYLWWSNGVSSAHYAIKTSRYGLSFDTARFTPTAFFPLAGPVSESTVLGESSTQSVPPSQPVSFGCRLVSTGSTNNVVPASSSPTDVYLVECGKFFQRRFHKVAVSGGLSLNSELSGLEVAAWPDRVSFVLRLVPGSAVTDATLEMTFGLTNAAGSPVAHGGGVALRTPDGGGFVFLKSGDSSTLAVNSSDGTVTVRTMATNWSAGQERSVGLIAYPVATDVAMALTNAVAGETSPLQVTATGIVPDAGILSDTYDADRGCHRVFLPASGTTGGDGLLRVRINVTNSSAVARLARLNFDGAPFYIPGISAVLRDADLNPIGIPVQLSKNWHGPLPPVGFAGWWFHGLTMLSVPPQTHLSFELTMVGQNWGGMPAATHSQLSVIGYYGHGASQWDEAALGNYGEAFCYDVDHGLTDNDCTDSRPMLVTDAQGRTGQWCANAGGASFLRYYDRGGQQRLHARMRTRYLRYCPNLAEAVFAGQTDDGKMEFSYSAGLFRSDDYTRAVHRLRVEVTSDLTFSRLVFFQQAADTYAYNNGTKLAYGNATNLAPLRQWTATFNQNRNIGTPVALTGPMPWTMTLDSPAESGYSAADRGFVIRSWRARINGASNVPPYLVERSVVGGSVFDLVPPPGVIAFQAGDFVEAEIVRFYIPRFASNYYGPNRSFRRALTNYQNSCQIGLREAVGNNLSVTPQWGRLDRLFPIQLEATNNRAGFTVTGGLGCVPVTITGLSDYRAPLLEEKVGDAWVAISQAVNGNDFWQCDYNAETAAWEITFTLQLDGPTYLDLNALMTTPPTRTFRFRMGGAQSPRFSAVSVVPGADLRLSVVGEPGSAFALLSSDTLDVPLANWTVVTNGTFVPNPTVLIVSIPASAPQLLYALRTM